ncbi:uncharacterized protein BKA78DRAFT_311925 [Phyllosticta capitalensis]|uniref:uncharacterized protein n=1 Tax=Phyllosticta capitalensis TaxID=121624 RepID=UPI00312CE2CC
MLVLRTQASARRGRGSMEATAYSAKDRRRGRRWGQFFYSSCVTTGFISTCSARTAVDPVHALFEMLRQQHGAGGMQINRHGLRAPTLAAVMGPRSACMLGWGSSTDWQKGGVSQPQRVEGSPSSSAGSVSEGLPAGVTTKAMMGVAPERTSNGRIRGGDQQRVGVVVADVVVLRVPLVGSGGRWTVLFF